MNTEGFDNLTLNGALVEAFYGNVDFLLNVDNERIKQTEKTIAPAIKVESLPKAEQILPKLTFEDANIYLIYLQTASSPIAHFEDILIKMLGALPVQKTEAKTIEWNNDLATLIPQFDNADTKKIIWVVGMQPNDLKNSQPKVEAYTILQLKNVKYMLTNQGPELEQTTNKKILWNFFKENIK
jgi:hypothetical protein